MLKLGRAQGVAIAAGLREIFHYRVRTQENKMAIKRKQRAYTNALLHELPKTSIADGLLRFVTFLIQERWWEPAILAGTLC
jgi:hypothetical protein